jgi:hypothetical protein
LPTKHRIHDAIKVKSFVITLRGNEYSERKAAQCIKSGALHGVKVKRFNAVSSDRAEKVMKQHGLRWTWANNNRSRSVCPLTGLKQHPYGNLAAKIGCSMSHYQLWDKCAGGSETFLILEHDAVFVRPLNPVDFHGICQINDPRGATPYGGMWSDKMAKRGAGIWPKTHIFPDDRPDGLAGNSAYLLKPEQANELMNAFHVLGVWPNDATMCRQLFDLQELYPFVTKTEQEQSTTSV